MYTTIMCCQLSNATLDDTDLYWTTSFAKNVECTVIFCNRLELQNSLLYYKMFLNTYQTL